MIAPALKEEERPALTNTTGLWDRGNPTIAECELKSKGTITLSTNVVTPAPMHGNNLETRLGSLALGRTIARSANEARQKPGERTVMWSAR